MAERRIAHLDMDVIILPVDFDAYISCGTERVIALIVLAIAVGAIYLILKNMGEEGIEVAAPGSCKSGRCGVRCAPVTNERNELAGETADEAEAGRQKVA